MTSDPLDAVSGPGDADGHYAALGVEPTATTEELRRAYRTLARAWHPDRNASVDTTTRMVRLNDAAAVLLDEHSRAYYDSRSAVPPLVLFASPSAAVQCSTFVGTPGRRIIEIGANRNVTAIDVSKLSGNGWTAELFAGTSDDIVLVIEITISAKSAGVVHDEIIVTAEDAHLRVSIDAQVDPVPAAERPRSSATTPPTAPIPTPPLSRSRFWNRDLFTPPRSKWQTRLTAAAWITALAQVFYGTRIVSPNFIATTFPQWTWPIAEFAFSSTSMLLLAAIAAFLTRGFTRWSWRTTPVAVLLLLPGIFAALFGAAVFVIIVAVIALVIVLFAAFA